MKIKIEELGPGLRKLRGKKKLRELGEELNLTASHINEMEHGDKMPSVNVLKRYSRVLNQKLNLVFDGDTTL
jgi:transcriptional regulator with XRE-family HTH domain